MKRISLSYCLAVVSLLALIRLLTGVAVAQDYRARVQGVVTDPSQAVIAKAKVTVTNIKTGYTASKSSGDTGQYLFDFVPPGIYRVSVEAAGFESWVQDNVTVLTREDVTVNAVMTVGASTQTVTVAATDLNIEFNTSTMSQTVDGKMLQELPVLARNPFTLALLNPAVVNNYGKMADRQPFFSLVSNGVDIGGNTLGRNDLLIDGVTTVVISIGSYTPPMDSVQEFSVEQNAVDAEFGHTAGGVISLSTKSGTNSLHGSAYYFGRNPALNAVANSITHAAGQNRYNIGGGNAGFPIIKNKLFAFASYEQWRSQFASTIYMTLPTDLMRTGDFSQSLNNTGGLRTIYDPWSTKLDPVTSAVTRTPFAGNVIPPGRMDPSSLAFMNDVWKANNPGDNPFTNINNYKLTFPWWSDYKNWSGRVDWNPSDKWKVYGRYSQFREWESNNNFTSSPAFTDRDGGLTATINVVADAVYTINSSTVLDLRWGIATHGIDYNSPWAGMPGGLDGYSKYWPNNPWYTSYMKDLPHIFYPRLTVGTYVSGMTGLWLRLPRKTSYEATLVKHMGRHNLKVGGSLRHQWEHSNLPDPMALTFAVGDTANTFVAPNTALSGDAWATFLLGAVQGHASYSPIIFTRENEWAGFIQDDIKLNRRVTLNLGLRDEYESAIYEDQNRMSRYLDLTNPIPEMQSSPPQMPAQVLQYKVPYQYNGAWVFTDSSNRGIYGVPRLSLQPRVGAAIRVNDKTAIRAGYARYGSTLLAVIGANWGIPQYGYTATTNVQSFLQGVPQATLSNPFPAANPLLPATGNSLGRYTNLGGNASWMNQNIKTPMNDRFNISLQRALPGGFRLDATYFLNLGHNIQPPCNGGGCFESYNQNMVDPQLNYTYGSALAQKVDNPFYHYLTPQTFPGQNRNLAQVSVLSLLGPYPQYGSLTQIFNSGFSEHYHSLQLKGERAFSRGFSFLMAYNYSREASDAYFNDPDTYAKRLTMLPSSMPRHRLNAALAYDLPFGKGRQYLNSLHPVLNAILGGWTTSHMFMWNSGSFLTFGQLVVNGDPVLSNPTVLKWFDTSVFKGPVAYTPRTNPIQYEGLTGPRFWNLDSTLAKSFRLSERFRLEFRFEAYNTFNNFIWGNPDLGVYSSTFGRATTQANTGRQCQYTLRLHF